MKRLIPPEERGRTIAAIIVVCTGILFAVTLLHLHKVWGLFVTLLNAAMPFIIGFAIAFLLLPIVTRVERFFANMVFRRKPHPRLSRILGVVIAYIVLIALASAFFAVLVPQLIASISSIIQYIAGFDFTSFISRTASRIHQWLSGIHLLGVDGAQLAKAWDDAVARFQANLSINGSEDFVSYSSSVLSLILNYSSNVLNGIKTLSGSLYTVLFQLFVGLISASYLLVDKETFCAQFKKVGYAILKKPTCDTLIFWARRAHHIFAGFITGKLLDSTIIGVLCYISMLVFGIEYPLLISVIVGVTNVIPFFGPYIGAIPCILILLLVNPLSALWFLVFIVILQQLDGNFIGPFILGDQLGLSAFWIMVAIIVGGKLFGFMGMLLSVPVFALLYAIVRTVIDRQLDKRSLPHETAAYVDIPEKTPMPKRERKRKK